MIRCPGCRLFAASGTDAAAKPINQCGQPAMMVFADRNKFQTETDWRLHMANHCLRINLAFLNEKMQLRLGASRKLLRRLDEKPSGTKIANS